MHVMLETDEAWSLMSVVTSYVIDHAGLSQEGKQRLRRWRTDRADGLPAMEALAEDMSETLGDFMDEATNRQVRQKGRYARKQETR